MVKLVEMLKVEVRVPRPFLRDFTKGQRLGSPRRFRRLSRFEAAQVRRRFRRAMRGLRRGALALETVQEREA